MFAAARSTRSGAGNLKASDKSNAKTARPAAANGKDQSTPKVSLSALKRQVERVTSTLTVPLDEPRPTSECVVMQVSTLQDAFLTLAGVLVAEVEDLRASVRSLQADRASLLGSVAGLQRQLSDKALEAEQLQLRLSTDTAALRSEVQAQLGREASQLSALAAGLQREQFELKCEVQLVRNQLCRVESMAAGDVPATVLAQRLESRRGVEAAVDEAVRGCAGRLVEAAVAQEVPGAVRGAVAGVMREVVQQHTESLRSELQGAVQRLSEAAGAAQAESEAAQRRWHNAELKVPALERRLAALEAAGRGAAGRGVGGEGGAGAAEVAGLHQQLQAAGRQQSGMEAVLRALVDDVGRLGRGAREAQGTLGEHTRQLAEQRALLSRCAALFPRLLDVPPPIPLGPDVDGEGWPSHPHGEGEAAGLGLGPGLGLSDHLSGLAFSPLP
ncbi:hypothetical protein HYH03_018734 [Edaphochlamys debaryana]|uniref:Uncharacterized protein n=1 Tax=Edaphochlamys debaryana TaxID=47281 RepID=A0A835XFF1_9CHLO|nr:hypothetical protein HYH03_018734 [Edaphochlamys debaryana]|eukprot:KAG2482325.1 hypothetical protein HYH03_018734 [Edaphochlamys debaryana]